MATGSFANLPIRFGRDKVEKLPGKGAMGAVYLARDTQLQRLVALKIPKLSGKGSEKLLKRLKTEAMAAAQDVIAALSAIGLAVASSVLGSTAPSSGYYSLGHSEIPASEL